MPPFTFNKCFVIIYKMRKEINKQQPNITITEVIARFFLGFLFPYIAINGLILFLFVSSPEIVIKDQNDNKHINSTILFTINSTLPIINVNITENETNIPYTKNGNDYSFTINENGSYLISATSINQMTTTTFATVETIDDTVPYIDLSTVAFSSNILSFNINDNESGINYENIYGTTTENKKIEPSYIDRSTGTIQFKLESYDGFIIHIEDLKGNYVENEF